MIVARSLNFSDPDLDLPIVEGQANPMRRDVFQIPSGESITLRVVADNPGAWLLHCKFRIFCYYISCIFFLTVSLHGIQVISNGILK